jgi:glycine/D-amino acid oxidase-like deaminating enzyme
VDAAQRCAAARQPAPDLAQAELVRRVHRIDPHYRRNTVETTRLAIAARQHLFAWAEAEGIDFDLKRRGILHIYRDKAGFDHAGQVSKLLAEGGLERRAVTPDEMRSIEPTLAGQYYGGYYTESDATGDIHKFTTGLAAAARAAGRPDAVQPGRERRIDQRPARDDRLG